MSQCKKYPKIIDIFKKMGDAYEPSRGGVRGGRDQFKWEDVKTDKDRENYLGHSLKAPLASQERYEFDWYILIF